MSERKKDVVVLTGAGSIGLAIARRVGLGSDFLMDGGVTASYWYGDLSPMNNK